MRSEWKVASDSGYGAAQFMLGSCYKKGQGVPVDDDEAVRWFRLSAQVLEECTVCAGAIADGDATEQCRSCAHQFHQGCARDLKFLGVKEVCAACRGGIPRGPERAFDAAARRYAAVDRRVKRGDEAGWDGLSERSQAEAGAAVEAWRDCAEQGHKASQFALGTVLENGRGVERNEDEAMRWFSMASAPGAAEVV